jgi:hypothetical protein
MSVNEIFHDQQKKMYQNKGRYDDERRAQGTKPLQAFDQIMMSENLKPGISNR